MTGRLPIRSRRDLRNQSVPSAPTNLAAEASMMWLSCIPASALRYLTVNAARPPSAIAMKSSTQSNFRNSRLPKISAHGATCFLPASSLGGATAGTRRMK